MTISSDPRGDPGVTYLANAVVPAPSLPEEASDGGQKNPSRIRRAADGLFYVIGRVNGQDVRFLIDTGASAVVLTAQDARRVGLASLGTNGPSIAVETASGESRVNQIVLEDLSVGKHGAKKVPAIVMQHGLKVSLLGQSGLERLGPITFSRYDATF